MEERIQILEDKLDRIIRLLEPVHAHADFVDKLKKCFYSKIFLPGRSELRIDDVD